MLGMAICQFILGVYFSSISDQSWFVQRYNDTLNHTELSAPVESREVPDHGYGWLAVLSVCLCLFLGNTGWFSLTWAVVGEVLPEETHNTANKVVAAFAYSAAFVSTKTFADLVESLGPHGAFFLYGCVCIFGAIFTCIFLPETKGRSQNQPDPVQLREMQQYSTVPNQA